MNKIKRFLKRIKTSCDLFVLNMTQKAELWKREFVELTFNKNEWFFMIAVTVSFFLLMYTFGQAGIK